MKKSQNTKISMNQPAGQSTQMPDKKTLANALDAEDKIELERREAYIEPKTRDLLRKLLQGGDKEEITPIYIPGSGYAYQITHKQLGKYRHRYPLQRVLRKSYPTKHTGRKLF